MVEVSWEERERTELRPSPRGRVVGAAVSVAVVVLAVAGLARGFGWPAWGEDEALPKLLPVHEPRTIHVAVDGDDDAEGTPDEPLRTIGSAVRASGAADTIVVHGGTYHEELKIENRPGLHLVAAPGAEVWLDGSVAVEHWVPDGDVWVAPGWGTRLDASPTYSWGAEDHDQPGWSFIDPEYPMAAHPDQVWVDDERQVQVGSRAEVGEGSFYVDHDRAELVLGTDPTGRTVVSSTLPRALRLRSEHMVLRDINVRRYAPSVPHMGAVTIEAHHVLVDGVTVADNATTGVHVLSTGVRLEDVELVGNGMLGLSATEADGLELLRVTARQNNVERFNRSPAAGGVKIGRSQGVVVRDSTFSGNYANGLWFDESVYDLRLVGSRMTDNTGHGVSVELTGHAVVADNVVARNGGNGLKLNDAEDVEVWNNTFADNTRSINVIQDDRDIDPRGSFRDEDLPLRWQTQDIAIRNNVIARTGEVPLPGTERRICLLCVEDHSGRWTAAEMDVTALGNVYQRPDAVSPRWVVVWSRRDRDPFVFRTLEEFRRTVNQEGTGAELTGTPALGADLRLLPALEERAGEVAQPLPRTIAELVGREPGEQHLGAWTSATPPP
ncbi:MAG TPA: right-handed parallel beta-helix repeat-containing protein [Phototrophicaceae bacterium]|nr:right-handed parallel beta-helix repeat-containing protein [Phototrophicaceae bacterium]